MGYDDADRSKRRQSRARQPVKRPGSREPEYRKNKEPGYEGERFRNERYKDNTYDDDRYRENRYREDIDPDDRYTRGRRDISEAPERRGGELNLITDSFGYADDRNSRVMPKNQTSHRKQSAAGRQSAAAKQSAAANLSAAAKAGDNGFYRTPSKKKAQKRRRKLIIILLEAVILISVLVFAAYSYLDKSMNMMQRLPWDPDTIKNVEISQEKQEQMKGYWTIAVFGVDSRNSSVGKGNNSDVNMICNINQDTGEIKLISIFRDTYLNISEKNSYNKINAAYLNGGPEQAVGALNKNLDLDIDDYAVFNWKAVADAINILDGIDVELSKAEFYYINAFVTETVKATGVPSEPVKHAGLVHLDGVQAVAYGRLRLMDTDYARTERQRKVIALAFEKAKKADWATLNNIVQTIFPQVSTSVMLTDVLGMGRDIGKLHLGESLGFPAARGEADMGSKGACVIPQTLERNVIDLHRFMFGDENYTPTATVQTISKKIISDTGLAKAAKPIDHVDTNGGSVPKGTKGSDKESKDKNATSSGYGESESGTNKNETKESGTHESTKAAGTDGWAQWETDEDGSWYDPAVRESRENNTVKPGTGKPGTGTTTKPSAGNSGTTYPAESETIAPRPGTNTDTGVILRPGEGTSGGGSGPGPNVPGGGSGTGGSQNVPGSTTGGSQNAPGGGGTTGGSQNTPGGGGTTGGNQNAPGSGGGSGAGPSAPGNGSGGSQNMPGGGNGNGGFSGPIGQ